MNPLIRSETSHEPHFLTYPSAIPFQDSEKSALIWLRFSTHLIKLYHHCQAKGAPSFENLNACKKFLIIKMDLARLQVFFPNPATGSASQMIRMCVCFLASSNQRIWGQKISFSFVQAEKVYKEVYWLGKNNALPEKSFPIVHFNGMEYERRAYYKEEAKIDKEKWELFERGQGFTHSHFMYRCVIHPFMNDTVLKAYDFLGRPLVILDICGGNGNLALSILNSLDHISEYHLLDQCTSLIANYKEHLSCSLPALEKLSIHTGDVREGNFFQFTQKGVDVVILCGVLAHQVLTKQESENVLRFAKEVSKPDTLYLISSFTIPYFYRKDYEKLGFEVLNMTVFSPIERLPLNMRSPHFMTHQSQNFYILKQLNDQLR